MQIKRGDIWYVESGYTTGSEQRPGRPAVVVSNDKNNEFGRTVEMVYLTTQPKRELPTHTIIGSLSRESTAICEQITTVAVERIGDYYGRVTGEEMAAIEAAMIISLDLRADVENLQVSEMPMADEATHPSIPHPDPRLTEAEAKCQVLQQLYDSLLDKLIRAG